MISVGINGFGRIGRCITRHIMNDRNDMEIVQINASGSKETNMHLLKYDSVHGRYQGSIQEPILWTEERDIEKMKWYGVDVVLECTGAFNDGTASIHHVNNGAKKVLISAPAKNVDRTVVYGINHEDITRDDRIISNASCTTNCLAPMASVLHKEFGIKRGMMTTVHSYTGDQATIDKKHTDLYRSRASAVNMIPTSTGASKNIGKIIPELQGKLSGASIRVPTPNVSCVDLTVEVQDNVTVKDVNHAFYTYSELFLPGILGFETAPLVSTDFNHTRESCIIASDQTQVVDRRMVRVLGWYDNEWGFSCRMADMAAHIGK